MKSSMKLIAIASLALISGCASTVTFYDSNGKVTAKCTASRGFLFGAPVSCHGDMHWQDALAASRSEKP